MARVCIIQPALNVVSETFIQAHGQRLPGVAAIVYRRDGIPWIGDRPVLAQHAASRAQRKLLRILSRRDWSSEIEAGYVSAIQKSRAQVVLAEYGTTGAEIAGACLRSSVPLVVHFHGYDASRHDVLKANSDRYRELFGQASVIVAVSRSMVRKLVDLGCPLEKLVYNPCGCEAEQFCGGLPATARDVLIAVGRFVEKKAPYLTLVAFSKILRECPSARLRMIGDGPFLGICRDLACALGIDSAVAFLGAQPHEVVQREMQQSRAFVQHSVVASDGDSEGTPVAVLEAGAMGLPVVATRHAGIPDVVVENETGLLVDERDVAGMAEHMLTLLRDPALAGELGRNAASHVRKYYTMEHSLRRLSLILDAAARQSDISAVRTEIEAEFPVRQSIASLPRTYHNMSST